MEQLNITDCGVSRLVDVRNIVSNGRLALLHILNLALSKTKQKEKYPLFIKSQNLMRPGVPQKRGNFLLRRYSVLQFILTNNEPFGKRKTPGEGFGRKLLGLQCLHL